VITAIDGAAAVWLSEFILHFGFGEQLSFGQLTGAVLGVVIFCGLKKIVRVYRA
jgi:hypothetical protein